MKIFGLVIMTGKAYNAERKQIVGSILKAQSKVRAAEAYNDGANKQVERLLHNGTELTLLWAAVRECGVDEQVGVVFKRLSPKEKEQNHK